ncbi:glycogen debranching protein [Actinocrinis puniceicyclus]|uniref:Glycogen debranching protein n=1 Tax=Actinocrinis puniceicyclus TaxID=977794 RepID=A0A8J7WRI6_9ACTN|nr:trehalase family glycosidase [Actinocrinis puniceicyclus]MBS2966183.1 glycogen debranching protein [Actinocrinis puniceicyclus]
MTVARTGPAFSVQDIPFSYSGSWFNISPVTAQNTYADDLHLVSHQTRMHPVLRFVPMLGGARVETRVVATPALLAWTLDGEAGEGAGDGSRRIELVYENADTVRLRGDGLGLRLLAANPTLTPFSGTYLYRDPVDGAHVFTAYETGRRYRVTVLSGRPVESGGVHDLGTSERGLGMSERDGMWEIAVEEFDSARRPYARSGSFGEVADRTRATFESFLEAVAPWRSARTPAAESAAYVLWSATVEPRGFLKRPAVLMSKHWMDKVWSWDHCFNAIALAEGAPGLARDQFQVPFDHQDETGALPDSVTHSEALYNFVKPPIHGWALRNIRARLPEPLEPGELAELYRRLERWTEFWLTARCAPDQVLPHYQHGNDSGWDNATTFDPERVIQTGDLAAFLILQARALADLADELGDSAASTRWAGAADRLRAAMLAQLWTGESFAARGVHTGARWTSGSLLDLVPVVLGAELPEDVLAAVAQRIKTHLTEFGLATESPSSPHYQEDGYWRGPIWAPSTILIEDGLRRGGHTDLADEISARFRGLCERSGFAENFGAQTGAPLRDRAYTWTASAYLILAAAHERRTARRREMARSE